MTTTEPIARAGLATARGAGAIAAVHLAGDIDGVLGKLGAATVAVGAVALRDLGGIDTGVVARLSENAALLTPHGGVAVVDALLGALENAGVALDHDDPRLLYPEAEDEVEALALHTLSRAASPRAAALLLDQPRRWRESRGFDAEHSAQLDRLVTPALVACVGRPNIGKSTLLNALAGRELAVVADEPGVTRDHVGALLELDGVVVRWIDAPGLREGESEVESQAIELALRSVRGADLVLLAGDHASPAATAAEVGVDVGKTLTLGLRADLGELEGAEVSVSAGRGKGLGELAEVVRRRLVSDEALGSPSAWRFHPDLAWD